MKRKSKTIGFLITGMALAVGIAISSGIIRNSYVADEAKALQGDVVATFQSSEVVSSSGYNMYQNDDWLLTHGGNNFSGGTNSKSRASCNLSASDYIKYAGNSGVSSSDTAFAIASKKTLSSVGKVILVHNGGSNNTRGSVYLTTSSDGTTYSKVTLTSGTQGATPTASMTYEFSTIGEATYYAIIIKDSGTSGNYRFDNIVVTFYEGAPARTLDSLSVSGTLNKTSYFAGESFDPSGLTISANYDDESSADVTSGCTFSPNPLTAGVTLVTASYMEGGVTKTVNIGGFSVSTRSVTSISVLANPTKTSYTIGQSFDPAGMIIRAVYNVGPTNDDYVAYIYSPTSVFDSVGEKTITITSTENASAMTTLNVDVVAVSSLNITIADTGYTGTSYATTAKTFTKSDVEFSMVNFLKPSGTSNMQFRTGTTDAFSFHNSIALPGIITKVTVQNVSGSPSSMTLYTGVSTQASSTSGGIAATFNSSDKTFSWDVNTAEQSKYLRLFNFTGSAACIFSNIEIEFLAEPEANEDAIAWGTDFLSATAAGCSALDQSQLLTAWSGLETSFNALSSEAKNYLTSLTPNVAGNDAQHAVARYIYIITKYGDTTFADFMNLDIQAAPSVFDLLDDGYNYVPLIAVVGVVGLTVLIGYYYLKKRQEA